MTSALKTAGQLAKEAEQIRHEATEELYKQIVAAKKRGMGPTAIAKEAGCARQTVYNALGREEQRKQGPGPAKG